MAAGLEAALRLLRQGLREGLVGLVDRVLPAAIYPHRQAAKPAGRGVDVVGGAVGGAVEGVAHAGVVRVQPVRGRADRTGA